MNSNIVLARIDDRLIHGQVMTAWIHELNIGEILIIDDATFKNSFLTSVMKSAIPSNIKLSIYDMKGGIEYIKETQSNLILLVKTPDIILELIKNGIVINKLNVGGMGSKPGRTKLYRNISATEEEVHILREIQGKGTDVFIQVVPSDKKVMLEEV